jgi:aryl-alcohol dehydrogenase-like predicted oxidoreductase
MQYTTLGESGLHISRACLGTMMFGYSPQAPASEQDSGRIIGAYLDAGGNFIDTANIYVGGESEEVVGRAIKTRRDEVVLATKGFGPIGQGPNTMGLGRKYLIRALEQSLRRLDTDFIDLYQCHRPDPDTPIAETMATLHGFVQSGKVRYVGCSNWTGSQIAEAQWAARDLGGTPFISLQPRYSLNARRIEEDILPACQRLGLGTMIYSPLGGGVLTGKYRPGVPPTCRQPRRPRRFVGANARRPEPRARRGGRQDRRRDRRHANRRGPGVGPVAPRRDLGDYRTPDLRAVRAEHGGLRPATRRRGDQATQ